VQDLVWRSNLRKYVTLVAVILLLLLLLLLLWKVKEQVSESAGCTLCFLFDVNNSGTTVSM